MIVGIVWPMPFKDSVSMLDPNILDGLRASRATHIRINADYRHTEIDQIVAQIREAGFEVLPILDLDYDRPDIPAYLDFCDALIERHQFPMVELLNEPKTMQKMSSSSYREILNATGERLQKCRPQTRL